MAIRLALVAVCSLLATCQASLVMNATTVLVELEEGKDPEPNFVLKKQYTVSVQCSMTSTSGSILEDASITWHKIESNSTLDSRYHSTDRLAEDKRSFTSVLTLRRPFNEDITNYTCTGAAKGLAKAVGTAVMRSRPLISFSVDGVKMSDVAVWPGQSLDIRCLVDGNPRGSAEWLKEVDGVTVSMMNSTALNLSELSYERDRGFVSCRSQNVIGWNSAKIFLRVKNPQAYLPPLIIIIAEVITVAIIVVVYELYMHRKRSRLEREAGDAYKTD